MAILLKAMYWVNVIPIKCQMTIDRQMDKEDVVCIHTHTHTHTHTYNGMIAIKDNKIMPFAATWMDLEIIIQRPVSYDSAYLWNLKKKDTNELIYKKETDSQT